MASEVRDQDESEWTAIIEVAGLLGIGTAEKMRRWVRQVQVDAGARPETTTGESQSSGSCGERTPNYAGLTRF